MERVAVLEDDGVRIAAMRSMVKESRLNCELEIFRNAHSMVRWLIENPNQAAALSLDRDLDTTVLSGEECGTGEDVVTFLASISANRYPVIIHSSNALRAPAMHLELALAGWTRVWLRPFTHADRWASDIRHAIASAVKT